LPNFRSIIPPPLLSLAFRGAAGAFCSKLGLCSSWCSTRSGWTKQQLLPARGTEISTGKNLGLGEVLEEGGLAFLPFSLDKRKEKEEVGGVNTEQACAMTVQSSFVSLIIAALLL